MSVAGEIAQITTVDFRLARHPRSGSPAYQTIPLLAAFRETRQWTPGTQRGDRHKCGRANGGVSDMSTDKSRPGLPQLTLAPKVRTITHLPARFSRRSAQTS